MLGPTTPRSRPHAPPRNPITLRNLTPAAGRPQNARPMARARRSARWLEGGDPPESLRHIRNQVIDILTTHREAHHEITLRHRVRQRVKVTQTHRDTRELKRLA